MAIEFTCKTNMNCCYINTAIFHLKNGGTITVDRCQTEFSVGNGELDMEWLNCYVWEVNDVEVAEAETDIPLTNGWIDLINDADSVEFFLEEDSGIFEEIGEKPEDYRVECVGWLAY